MRCYSKQSLIDLLDSHLIGNSPSCDLLLHNKYEAKMQFLGRDEDRNILVT